MTMQEDSALTNSPRDVYDFERVLRVHKENHRQDERPGTTTRRNADVAKVPPFANHQNNENNNMSSSLSPARKLRRLKRQLLLQYANQDPPSIPDLTKRHEDSSFAAGQGRTFHEES
jgi:hypothetical protein